MLITIREAAELLKVTEQTAYIWARNNQIPGILRIGRTIRVDDEQIRDFIKRGGSRGLDANEVDRIVITRLGGKEHAGGAPRNDAGGPIPLEMSPKAQVFDPTDDARPDRSKAPESWIGRDGAPQPKVDHD